MNLEQVLVFLAIGAAAGWLSGLLMKGGGFGVVGNIVLGVLGAVVGGWLFGVLKISVGGRWIGPIVTATAGSVVLLVAVGFVRRK